MNILGVSTDLSSVEMILRTIDPKTYHSVEKGYFSQQAARTTLDGTPAYEAHRFNRAKLDYNEIVAAIVEEIRHPQERRDGSLLGNILSSTKYYSERSIPKEEHFFYATVSPQQQPGILMTLNINHVSTAVAEFNGVPHNRIATLKLNLHPTINPLLFPKFSGILGHISKLHLVNEEPL